MLKIIGWLGCVYLIVKALEIGGSSSYRNERGELNGPAVVALIIALFSAVGFAFWLFVQGGAVGSAVSNLSSVNPGLDISRYSNGTSGYLQCSNDAKSLDEKLACGKLIQ